MEGVREELNKRQVGGDTFQANGILEEVSKVHERMMEVMRLQALGTTTNRRINCDDDNELEGFFHVAEEE